MVTLSVSTYALLTSFQVIRGDTTGAVYDHLLAAKPLLAKVLSDLSRPIPPGLRVFLTEYYTYTATLSIISIDARISNQILLPEEIACAAKVLVAAGYTGNLCGCWLELLLLIPDVFEFRHGWFLNRSEGRPLKTGDILRFAEIQQRILQWEPKSIVETDVVALGRLYQSALLLYLYTAPSTATGSYQEEMDAECYQRLITTTVTKSMEHLRQLPLEARVNTNMCWPLTILGSCVTDSDHRQQIRARLLAMNRTLGFGNIRQTLALLEEMWNGPTDETGPWNVCVTMQKLDIWISFT